VVGATAGRAAPTSSARGLGSCVLKAAGLRVTPRSCSPGCLRASSLQFAAHRNSLPGSRVACTWISQWSGCARGPAACRATCLVRSRTGAWPTFSRARLSTRADSCSPLALPLRPQACRGGSRGAGRLPRGLRSAAPCTCLQLDHLRLARNRCAGGDRGSWAPLLRRAVGTNRLRVAHHGPSIAAETVPGRNFRTDPRVRTGSKNRICIGIRNCSGVRPAVRLSLPLVRLSRPLLMSCAAQGGFRGWSNPRCCSSDSSLRSDGGAADARALAPGGPGGRTGRADRAGGRGPHPHGRACCCLSFLSPVFLPGTRRKGRTQRSRTRIMQVLRKGCASAVSVSHG
jgi:hypothetical protein